MSIEDHAREVGLDRRKEKTPKASLVEQPEVKDGAEAVKIVDDTAKAAVKKGEREAGEQKSKVLTSMPDFDEIGKIAIDNAKGKAAEAGLKWSARIEDVVRNAAIDKHAKYHDQLKTLLSGDYAGFDGRTFIEDDGGPATVEEFLGYPAMLNILGLPMGASAKGLFPGLKGQKLQDGDHVLISEDKSYIAIVRDKNPKDPMAFVYERHVPIATANRDDVKFDKMLAMTSGYKVVDGVIRFTSKKAAAEKTLGNIAKEQRWKDALLVDGKLAVKGKNGEYYKVDQKSDNTYYLNANRVLALDGTKVDQKIPDNMASIVEGVKANRRA